MFYLGKKFSFSFRKNKEYFEVGYLDGRFLRGTVILFYDNHLTVKEG